MTENSPKLSRFDLKPYIPKDMIVSYFEGLFWNDKMYLTLIEIEGQSPRMYLESVKNSEEIIRIFHDLTDASIYSKVIAEKERIDERFIKTWEIKFHDLITYLNKVSNKYNSKNKKNIKMIASGFYKEKLVELDMLWTDIERFIN